MKPIGANRGPNFQYDYSKLPNLKATKPICKVQFLTLTSSKSSSWYCQI